MTLTLSSSLLSGLPIATDFLRVRDATVGSAAGAHLCSAAAIVFVMFGADWTLCYFSRSEQDSQHAMHYTSFLFIIGQLC